MSTLTNIRTKVRRLTRSPSEAQITTAQLDDYVNDFVLYDFPEHLRLFSLRETLKFYTIPNVDTYPTLPVSITDPLFDFANRYITIHDPIYMGGRLSWFSQSREEFFLQYPLNNSEQVVARGNGVLTLFTGTLTTGIPFLQNNVTVGSADVLGNALTLRDLPTSALIGNLVVPDDTTVAAGTINYVTGVFTFDFALVGLGAPANGTDVTVATKPYVAARPDSLLYFDDIFTIRPVPDKVYPVDMEVYRRPTQLLLGTDEPDIEQWWQYIAYGAAKKVFEDRMDIQSIQMIMPEFKQQERLVLRRTIVQQTEERTATIYTDQTNYGSSGNNGGFGPF